MAKSSKLPQAKATTNPEGQALWGVGILAWKLWKQQEQIYYDIRNLPANVDEAVVLCARQFGKSSLGVLLAIEDCLQNDDVCVLIVGPTIKQTRNIVTPRLRMFAKDAPPGLIKPSKSEGKWYIGKSELVIGGMDQNSSSERGKTLHTVYVEEIVDSDPDQYIESLKSDIGPALTHSKNGKIIFLTTPPKMPDHPFVTDTMPRAEMNNALYVYTIDQNKAITPQQYEACVRRCGGVHTEAFQREYLCKIIRDKGTVIIPDFDKTQDVSEFVHPIEMFKELYIDWGGVKDFTVAQVVAYDFLNDTDLVFQEMWWPPNTSTEQIVADLKEKIYPHHKITASYADVPGQVMVDLHSVHKLSIRSPEKRDWQANINYLSVRFSNRKIKIHPSCKLTIQTCQSGFFNKQKTDFGRSQSLGHMDAVACLMYAIRNLNRETPYSITAHTNIWQYHPPPGANPAQQIMPKKSFAPVGFKRF